jgi:glutamate synthase domain-containing protein 2
MSKMGVSTYMSYCGAQLFEAIGINSETVQKYFTGTPSRVEGIGIFEMAEEGIRMHKAAFGSDPVLAHALDAGGEYAWRARGEEHMWTPDAIAKLQQRQASLAGEAAATRSAQHGARLPKQPKARWKDFLVPSWADLMMWAVLVGQEDLAWLLWKKTTMPMRSALMASRVMDRIANADPDDSVDTEQARRYERWAIETLGRVRDRKAAMDLLTFVQKKKVSKNYYLKK